MVVQFLADLVRPVLTLAFAATLIYLTITGQMDGEFLKGVATGAITYWFAEKAALKVPGTGG